MPGRRRPLRARATLALALLLVPGCGGPKAPVAWSASIDGPDVAAAGSVARVRVEARAEPGWYFYSLTQPAGGPVPAMIELADSATFRPAGSVVSEEPDRSFDSVFKITVEKHRGATSFMLPVLVPPETSPGKKEIRVSALYQACNDTVCLSPRTVLLTVSIRIESP